eukprot:CAMPEP_0185798760 /NCGR_PEP_ID=MMETSP1174-20130828/162319_1 /TAXON_ID=35687 /ORGANISM="Dictyocha speculum, Strain CCMP1381" /LENGTH=117 /DNA_ID=CAMNT_0028494275 /DNA_START=574 /DNA_END=927 /DNA_ORIENTATION=-
MLQWVFPTVAKETEEEERSQSQTAPEMKAQLDPQVTMDHGRESKTKDSARVAELEAKLARYEALWAEDVRNAGDEAKVQTRLQSEAESKHVAAVLDRNPLISDKYCVFGNNYRVHRL